VKESEDREFLVKQAYSDFSVVLKAPSNFHINTIFVMGLTWESYAPSNVVVFSWKLLPQRIPTRWNLYKRKVIQDEDLVNCVRCNLFRE
jgi:hypothetical protein